MRRHDLAAKLAAYGEVRGILAAMKNIALMELRKLGGQLERQRRALGSIERAADDFLRFYAPPGAAAQGLAVCIVIGSERGFCGEFNEVLAEATRARSERLLVVGARLAERLGVDGGGASLSGASVVDELPAVLERVAAWLVQAQRAAPGAPLRVAALYQDPDEPAPTARIIAPLPVPAQPARARGYAPRLTLTPARFFSALAEQALLLALQEAFSVSLLAENRRRLEHMDGALRRLDETTAALGRRMNAYRQEEITEEIEVIMLSAEALAAQLRSDARSPARD